MRRARPLEFGHDPVVHRTTTAWHIACSCSRITHRRTGAGHSNRNTARERPHQSVATAVATIAEGVAVAIVGGKGAVGHGHVIERRPGGGGREQRDPARLDRRQPRFRSRVVVHHVHGERGIQVHPHPNRRTALDGRAHGVPTSAARDAAAARTATQRDHDSTAGGGRGPLLQPNAARRDPDFVSIRHATALTSAGPKRQAHGRVMRHVGRCRSQVSPHRHVDSVVGPVSAAGDGSGCWHSFIVARCPHRASSGGLILARHTSVGVAFGGEISVCRCRRRVRLAAAAGARGGRASSDDAFARRRLTHQPALQRTCRRAAGGAVGTVRERGGHHGRGGAQALPQRHVHEKRGVRCTNRDTERHGTCHPRRVRRSAANNHVRHHALEPLPQSRTAAPGLISGGRGVYP